MTLFAGAAWNANTGAKGIRVLAGAIATFALTVFFIVATDWCWHGDGIFWADTAVHGFDANAMFVFQVTGFAEAADDAVLGAHIAGMGFRAGGSACGAAWHEDFVFFALRNFWWVSEEHVRLSSIAFTGGHADTVGVSQHTFLAEASNDAVLGADWARVGVGAGGGASGATWVEYFVVGAFRSGMG